MGNERLSLLLLQERGAGHGKTRERAIVLLGFVSVFGLPIAVAWHGFGANLKAWWAEWRWSRTSAEETYRFVITAHGSESEIRIPVWYERADFSSAAQAAIELQEGLFAATQLVSVTSADRSWAYFREPEVWHEDIREEIVGRIEELTQCAERDEHAHVASVLLYAARRLLFLVRSDASSEDIEGAWAIIEEDLASDLPRDGSELDDG